MRTPTCSQYEEDFKGVYRDIRNRMLRVPKRRRRYVADPVMVVMNKAYRHIMDIDERVVGNSEEAQIIKLNAIREAEDSLLQIQKPFYVYWNICGDPEEPAMKPKTMKKQAIMCDEINGILKMLRAMETASPAYLPDSTRKGDYITYYNAKAIRAAKFLAMIQRLHQFTHGKLVRLNEGLKNAEGDIIQWLIDDAWYHALEGNKYPQNEEEIKERRAHFSSAISDLYEIQRPIFSLISTADFSDKELTEWNDLLNESLKLLHAVQKSDGERFKV